MTALWIVSLLLATFALQHIHAFVPHLLHQSNTRATPLPRRAFSKEEESNSGGTTPSNNNILTPPPPPVSSSTTEPSRHKRTSTPSKSNKNAWSYSYLSKERRQQVLKLVTQLEQSHLENFSNTQEWIDEGLNVVAQWARLGEGKRAESAAEELLLMLQLHDIQKNVTMQAHRRVLNAWCNQLKRTSWKHSKNSRPSIRQLKEWKELVQEADRVLKKLEPMSLDEDGYRAVLEAYAQCQQVASALHTLQRWESASQQQKGIGPPTAVAYGTVIRCILHSRDVQWYLQKGVKLSPVEMAHSLLEECPQAPSLQTYNRVLDAWSKSLPPWNKHSKQRGNKSNLVVLNKAEWIWNRISDPDARSHVLMIYTYCKCGQLDKAFAVWEQLLQRLLLLSTKQKERVDARSFRVLVNALAASGDENVPERIDSILEGMWELDKAGYDDTAPDVYMYTTAMNAHAQHESGVPRAIALLDDLERRYLASGGQESLQRDVAMYNALIHAIASQANATNAAEEAGSVVKVMEREAATTNPKVLPDTITYNTLIDACLASDSTKSRERAEQTLLWMVDEFKSGNARVKPSLKTFSSVIQAWAAGGSAARAEALLDRMEERYRPPVSLFESVILAWCKQADLATPSESVHAAGRAKNLLGRMEELYEATGNEALRPTRTLYNAVIKALNDSGDLYAGQDMADTVLQHRDRMYPPMDSSLEPRRITSNNEVFDLLKHLENAPRLAPRPSVRSFNTVISLLGKSGQIWAGQRAEDILNYMLELHLNRGNNDIVPGIVTFNSVLAAWARSSHPNAGQRATAVLEKLDDLHDMGALEDVRADRVSFNTVMNAYAKSADPRSGSMAEHVFHELEAQDELTLDASLRPDIVSYTTLLNAWANSGEPHSAKRAEQILLRMIKNYKEDRNNVEPSTRCFNEVIYAWAKSQDKDASERAELVLRLMQDMYSSGNDNVKPDTRTFNLVLYALANSAEEDAPMRAQLLLDQMKDEERKGNAAVKPDIVSYKTLISAWAKLGGPGSVNATLALLEEVHESELEPDSSFFSNLIYCLARTGAKEAPKAAEKIVEDLKRKKDSGGVTVEVNTEIYNALLHCWGKSGERGAARRAEAILEDMEDEYAQGNRNVKPDVQTFTAVIDAYAKSRDSDAAKRAEAILNRMEDDARVRPNVHTYTALIQNYARSDIPSKAAHAQSILQRMKDDYERGNEQARPNTVAFNAVLNACEFSFGDASVTEQAFQIACETLDELRSSDYLTPNHITFGTFFGVIAKLMPNSDTRNELVELVFKRCCADGQLGPVVLKKLQDAASTPRYKKLLGDFEDDMLPSKWTCNVSE